MSNTLVLPKLDGIALAPSAAVGMVQTYRKTPKSIRRTMNGSAKAQQNYVKITTDITGSGWQTSGWDGLDHSSTMVLSCAEARTVADASNVIDITANRRSDVALRCFAMVGGEWVSSTFSVNVNQVTVTAVAGATQYKVGYYPQFSAFIEINQTGKLGWSLTAEEV